LDRLQDLKRVLKLSDSQIGLGTNRVGLRSAEKS
jgi:hypothetical protein